MPSPGPNDTVKILSILGQYPDDERELRERIIRESAPPGTEVVFKTYGESVFRAQMNDYHRTIIAPMYVEKALEGEREGVHAVVGFGTLDLGVEEMRHRLSIPVIGTGRAGIQTARILARRFALICYDYPHVIMYRKLLREWDGADADITSIRALDVPLTRQVSATDEMRKKFVALARKAIDEEGAQLILPLGTMIVPGHFSAEELADEIGTTVLDVMAIGMSLGAMLARKGFRPSREAYPSDDEPGRYRQ